MFMTTMISAQNIPEEIQKEIDSGEYTKAQKMISEYVETNKLPDSEKEALLFESERLKRIKKDFYSENFAIIRSNSFINKRISRFSSIILPKILLNNLTKASSPFLVLNGSFETNSKKRL